MGRSPDEPLDALSALEQAIGWSFTERAHLFRPDSEAGRFEDYLMTDVWDFLHERFPIRPDRESHVIAGVSMGGGCAFNKAFKYRAGEPDARA